jgi:hypothetical protein
MALIHVVRESDLALRSGALRPGTVPSLALNVSAKSLVDIASTDECHSLVGRTFDFWGRKGSFDIDHKRCTRSREAVAT